MDNESKHLIGVSMAGIGAAITIGCSLYFFQLMLETYPEEYVMGAVTLVSLLTAITGYFMMRKYPSP